MLFDEFDLKEYTTTDHMKAGKKLFQQGCISNAQLSRRLLTGTFTKKGTAHSIEIQCIDTGLVGRLNDVQQPLFTPPIIALAYWYINYLTTQKNRLTSAPHRHDTIPLDALVVVLNTHQPTNCINLHFKTRDTHALCDESHFFIHLFSQIIAHFDPSVQSILSTIHQQCDDAFFHPNTEYPLDDFLSNGLIRLISTNQLYCSESLTPIVRQSYTAILKVVCTIENHHVAISFYWVTPDQTIPLTQALLCNNHVIIRNDCIPIKHARHAKIAHQFNHQGLQRLAIEKITPFIEKMVYLRKTAHIQLGIDPTITKLTPIACRPTAAVSVTLSAQDVLLTLYYVYNDVRILPSFASPYIVFDSLDVCHRNPQHEQDLRHSLLKFHPHDTTTDTLVFSAPNGDAVLGALVQQSIPNIALLRPRPFTVSTQFIAPSLRVLTPKNHQADVSVHWQFKGRKMDHAIRQHLHNGIPVYLDTTNHALIPIQSTGIPTELAVSGRMTLPIGVVLDLVTHHQMDITLPTPIQTMVTALTTASKIAMANRSVLRPFQRKGVEWLMQRHHASIGRILADDMGLGKTIQTISLLATLYNHAAPKRPSLIIMPKTLLFNWHNECAKFAPNLRILVYDGQHRRTLVDTIPSVDVVLASYHSMRLDASILTKQSFYYLVLDEAQYIKNRQTNAFKAIKKYTSDHRVLITGTPIENSVSDLWSLMDIANPGYFGPYKPFMTQFDKTANTPLLQTALAPVLLRRKKHDVLTDLPPVSIQELWVTPSDKDIRDYTAIAKKAWASIEQTISDDGIHRCRMHIFALMTKLRQWCAHPGLLDPSADDGPKYTMFLDRLTESMDRGHKMVVFSQFIPFIDRLRQALDTMNQPHTWLTGQTKNRDSVIQEFNSNPDIQVGIFSLKAGGVGINLTSADYVFLYEPWWNPAVEQQAIDRVHRMGQTMPVTVFKCLLTNTIEERMIRYQSEKKQLIDSIINETALSNVDIDDLKQFIGIS